MIKIVSIAIALLLAICVAIVIYEIHHSEEVPQDKDIYDL
jgi:hypothetical protein